MWIKKKNKFHMTVMPGSIVHLDEEFFVAYGDEHWCQEKFPFQLLQKAVWRYRKDIDLSSNGCWPHHSLAHELFNITYNGMLPFNFDKCSCMKCVTASTDIIQSNNCNIKNGKKHTKSVSYQILFSLYDSSLNCTIYSTYSQF